MYTCTCTCAIVFVYKVTNTCKHMYRHLHTYMYMFIHMMFISDMCLYMYILYMCIQCYMYILYMCIQCYMYIQYPQWLLHIWYILFFISFLICLLVAFARETVAKLVPRLVRSDGVQQPLIDSLFARVNQVQFTLDSKKSQYMYCSCSVQYSTVYYMYSTVQYSTVQYSTVQYSTVQYSTVQYGTVQYSTLHYSTVHYATLHVRIQYMFETAYM